MQTGTPLVRNVITELRPEYWREVVGQRNTVATLQRTIASNKLPNALLFSGPMGSGKTTLARLLAKATACSGRKSGESEPCGQCDSCQAFYGDISSYMTAQYIGSARQLSDGELVDMVTTSMGTGMLLSDSALAPLMVDDLDALPKKQQVRLRSFLDARWPAGLLVATTMVPDKLDQPLRQRMVEFSVLPPDQPTLESWIERVVTQRLGIEIKEGHAVGQLVRLGEMNFRAILKILTALYAAESPLNTTAVRLAAIQAGYGLR